MKIKHFIQRKNLLKLCLIKNRINEFPSESFLFNFIENTLTQIKTALRIIFSYNREKKNQILFLGLPKYLRTKINLKTRHLSIPKNFNIKQLSLIKSNKKNFVMQKINYKPDLLVVFNINYENKYHSFVIEAIKSKIPIVEFIHDKTSSYPWGACYSVFVANKSIKLIFLMMLDRLLTLKTSRYLNRLKKKKLKSGAKNKHKTYKN